MVGKKCYLSPIDIDDAAHYAEWLNSIVKVDIDEV